VLSPDQIVDDFVRKVQELQEVYARTRGPLLPEVYRRIVGGMTITRRTKPSYSSGISILDEPHILRSLVDRYDVSQFLLMNFEFLEQFVDYGSGRVQIGIMGAEDVLFDTWRRTIEVRPQPTDRTVLLASDQRHLLDLLLLIQQTQITASEQMVYAGVIMDSEEWIAEAGRIGGGEGVSVFFSRSQ